MGVAISSPPPLVEGAGAKGQNSLEGREVKEDRGEKTSGHALWLPHQRSRHSANSSPFCRGWEGGGSVMFLSRRDSTLDLHFKSPFRLLFPAELNVSALGYTGLGVMKGCLSA